MYVCENNLYSVYSPLNVRQPRNRPIHRLAKAHGIEAITGDGNDVLAVYKAAQQAVDTVRTGRPVFLEFATYRWREHCGPNFDNKIGYRTEAEFLEFKAKCPVARLENHLLEKSWPPGRRWMKPPGKSNPRWTGPSVSPKTARFPTRPPSCTGCMLDRIR